MNQFPDCDDMGIAKEHKLQEELDKLNRDSAINRTIALHLGYTFEDKEIMYDGSPIRFRLWKSPTGGGMETQQPPNYVGDLNAMHEVEVGMSVEEFPTYAQWLLKVVQEQEYIAYPCFTTRATAAQRAEAFLKTLNKWNPEWEL